MNNRYLADTMALILRLEKRKMPKRVKDKFLLAEKGENEIVVPAMVFAELAYLSERERIDTTLAEAEKYLAEYPSVTECPMTVSTIKKAFEIDDVPELHDRLIAASAKELDVPVLTNDPDIRHSHHVKSIWDR